MHDVHARRIGRPPYNGAFERQSGTPVQNRQGSARNALSLPRTRDRNRSQCLAFELHQPVQRETSSTRRSQPHRGLDSTVCQRKAFEVCVLGSASVPLHVNRNAARSEAMPDSPCRVFNTKSMAISLARKCCCGGAIRPRAVRRAELQALWSLLTCRWPHPATPLSSTEKVDQDPWHQIDYANPLAARLGIAALIRCPLGRLPAKDLCFTEELVEQTLNREAIAEAVTTRFGSSR